jgi:hypothetical protein
MTMALKMTCRHCEAPKATKQAREAYAARDCVAEPVLGLAEGKTRGLCAEHERQLGGGSPLSSLMVAKD